LEGWQQVLGHCSHVDCHSLTLKGNGLDEDEDEDDDDAKPGELVLQVI